MTMAARTSTRTTITVLITLCLVYFVLGGAATWINWIPTTTYVNVGGIVGALASVLGLISLVRPGIAQSDISELEANSLRAIADTAEQIKQLEAQRLATVEEIGSLEERRKTLELIVQKAALSLFLKEQAKLYVGRINDEIRSNSQLGAYLTTLRDVEVKLVALGAEIESDPNVELLRSVIRESQPQDAHQIVSVDGLLRELAGVLVDIVEQVANSYIRVFTRLFSRSGRR